MGQTLSRLRAQRLHGISPVQLPSPARSVLSLSQPAPRPPSKPHSQAAHLCMLGVDVHQARQRIDARIAQVVLPEGGGGQQEGVACSSGSSGR